MEGLRLLALAGTIAAAMLGTLYAGAADGDSRPAPVVVAPEATSLPALPEPMPEPIPEGQDASQEILAMLDAVPEIIVDPETGVRIGPLTFGPSALGPASDAVAPVEPVVVRTRPARRARPAPPPPPRQPRLHSNPGRHVIATARGMIARQERIQGSCYRYLSEVFARAGHDHWRTRRVVYREGRGGPYADLGVIRPGDWLYIVNHPERVPVGTHSVLFVGWEDRARGYARVIEHSGWGAPSAGQERSYDVSRTYRVLRPVLSR